MHTNMHAVTYASGADEYRRLSNAVNGILAEYLCGGLLSHLSDSVISRTGLLHEHDPKEFPCDAVGVILSSDLQLLQLREWNTKVNPVPADSMNMPQSLRAEVAVIGHPDVARIVTALSGIYGRELPCCGSDDRGLRWLELSADDALDPVPDSWFLLMPFTATHPLNEIARNLLQSRNLLFQLACESGS